MSFLELAKKRGSIRSYLSDSVSEEDLKTILEAGRVAPSAANFQPWHFIVIRDEAMKAKLRAVYDKDWFYRAPVIIVVCVDPVKAWSRLDGKNYGAVDGAIAMDHITLCATDLGLGTCWIGAFEPAKMRTALDLPKQIEPIAMTPLGKPASDAYPKKRKDLSEIVHWERW